MSNGKKLALAAVLLVGTAQVASAGVIAQEIMYAPGPSSTATHDIPFNQTLNFNGFAATAAADGLTNVALTGVTLEVIEQSTISGTYAFSTANQTLKAGASDQAAVYFLVNTSGQQLLTNPGDGVVQTTLGTSGSIFSTSSVNFGPIVLTPWSTGPVAATSTSPYDFSWQAFVSDTGSTTTSSNPSNGTVSPTEVANVTVEALYSYSSTIPAVPEPASMALLASGLLAIGMVRRRRRG